jgi:hypothetical protein
MNKTINQDFWRDNTDRLEAYLYNTMTADERASFETELAANSDLAAALAAQRAEHRFFELAMQADLRKEITVWRQEETAVLNVVTHGVAPKDRNEKDTKIVAMSPPKNVVPLSRYIFRFAAAASILLVIGFGIKTAFFTPNVSNLDLAMRYYDAPSIGSKSNETLTDIEKNIKDGQFQAALSALNALNEPTEAVQIAFLKGHCQFKLAQFADAVRTFEQIPTATNDPLSIERSEWLLLLSKLAVGAPKAEWQSLLNKITSDGHAYRKQGLELKKQI